MAISSQMGCTSSSLDSYDENAFSGIYFSYKEDFTAMFLQEYEGRKLYKIFVSIRGDPDGDHRDVAISKVLDYFSLENSNIFRRSLMGLDASKLFVTYRQLVISLWNICSLPDKFAGADPYRSSYAHL